MIRNLGRVLSVVIAQEAAEEAMHMDVSAFNAPSECHSLVARGADKRMKKAIAEAERLAGASWESIKEEAELRGFRFWSNAHSRVVSQIMERMLP